MFKNRGSRYAAYRRSVLTQLLFSLLLVLAVCSDVGHTALPVSAFDSSLLIAPYLQLGDSGSADSIAIMWAAQCKDNGNWKLEYKLDGSSDWKAGSTPGSSIVFPDPGQPFPVYKSDIQGLGPGQKFSYRVSRNQKVVFTASAANRKSTPYTFAVFGDCGANSSQQKSLAARLHGMKPDLAVLTGDLVYNHGEISEYLTNFFPIYNADRVSNHTGAPLMRSTLFVGVPGNHDISQGSHHVSGNLNDCPDGLAYFMLWSQPLNGPTPQKPTPVGGQPEAVERFKTSAGNRFPVMASFSFDVGDTHWTVLDANPYVDWLNPKMQAWLEADLKGAQKARWKFVAYHQVAFHSGHYHEKEQQMRKISPLLERYGVDVVFAGHVHSYQRTAPLKFKPTPAAEGSGSPRDRSVLGEFTIDRSYDGKTDTTPQGPIYVLSGTGGAHLTGHEESMFPQTWKPFTVKYLSNHSFTFCDLTPAKLTIRQIDADGHELDTFVITKPRELAATEITP